MREPTTDIDVLNARLYDAVRDGYIELGEQCQDPTCRCGGSGREMRLSERGLARAQVLAQADGIDFDEVEDSIAVAISLVTYGFIFVSRDE